MVGADAADIDRLADIDPDANLLVGRILAAEMDSLAQTVAEGEIAAPIQSAGNRIIHHGPHQACGKRVDIRPARAGVSSMVFVLI